MYTTAAGIFHPFNKLLKAHCFPLSFFRLFRVTLIKRCCPVPRVSNEAELVVSRPLRNPWDRFFPRHRFLLSSFRPLRVSLIKRYCFPKVANEVGLVVSRPFFSRHTSPDLGGIVMNAAIASSATVSSAAKRTYLRFENPARQRAGLDRRILAESAPDARCPRFRHCDKTTFKSVRDHVRPQHLKNGRRGRGLIDSGAL